MKIYKFKMLLLSGILFVFTQCKNPYTQSVVVQTRYGSVEGLSEEKYPHIQRHSICCSPGWQFTLESTPATGFLEWSKKM